MATRDSHKNSYLATAEVVIADPRPPTVKFDVAVVGAAAGVAFYGSTLPIDRVKTIMMTQDLRRPRFASPVDCARDIYLHQGLRGFYRASLPTLLRTACGQAVALTVYGLLR